MSPGSIKPLRLWRWYMIPRILATILPFSHCRDSLWPFASSGFSTNPSRRVAGSRISNAITGMGQYWPCRHARGELSGSQNYMGNKRLAGGDSSQTDEGGKKVHHLSKIKTLNCINQTQSWFLIGATRRRVNSNRTFCKRLICKPRISEQHLSEIHPAWLVIYPSSIYRRLA